LQYKSSKELGFIRPSLERAENNNIEEAFLFGVSNKRPEMATSKEPKKYTKCCEEIQIHTNRNDLTPRTFYSP